MLNKRSAHIFFLLFSLCGFCQKGYSQNLITYTVYNQPLNSVLNKISSETKTKFAFDDDYLSGILVSFEVTNVSVEQFLKLLAAKYPFDYKSVGSTWVLFKSEKKENKKITQSRKQPAKKTESLPPVRKKNDYKVPRLWDLKGVVFDVSTGKRIRYCKLNASEYVKPVTGFTGYFSDEVVSKSDVQIRISQMGYYDLDTTITLSDKKEINIKLIPEPPTITRGKNIPGNRGLIDSPERDRFFSLNPRMSYYLPGYDVTDMAAIIQLIPGISLSGGYNRGLQIHGMDPSGMLILLDDMPVYNGTHLSGRLSSLNSSFINQAFISRTVGGRPEYGEAVSGIVDLSSRTDFNKNVAELTGTLLDANLYIGIPLTSKLAFSAAFRKSLVDIWPNYYYKNLAVDNVEVSVYDNQRVSGQLSDFTDNYYDITTKLSWQPNNRNELDLIVVNGYDHYKRDYIFSSGTEYYLDIDKSWNNTGAGLNWKFVSENKWNNAVGIYYINTNITGKKDTGAGVGYNSRQGNDFQTKDESVNSGVQVKWKSEFAVRKMSHSLGAEVDLTHVSGKYIPSSINVDEIKFLSADSVSLTGEEYFFNLFYQGKYKPNDWITLTAGVRGTYEVLSQNVFFQPTAGIDIELNDYWKFYYHWGKHSQAVYQTRRYDTVFSPTGIWYLSKSGEGLLNSLQHSCGIGYVKNGFLINFGAFFMSNNGQQVLIPSLNSRENMDLYTMHSLSQKLNGFDVLFEYRQRLFNHIISYSYSNSREKINGVNSDQYYLSPLQPKHRLQLSEMVSYQGWVATMNFNYLSGMSYLLPGSFSQNPVFSDLPGAYNFDFLLVKHFTAKSFEFEAGLQLRNLLNQKNPTDICFYSVRSTRNSFLAKAISYNESFSPSFYFRIRID